MTFTLLGISKIVSENSFILPFRLVQPKKALFLMVSNPSGNVILIKLVHSLKEFSPIVVKVLGNVTFFRFVHPEKALSSKDAIGSAITNSFTSPLPILSSLFQLISPPSPVIVKIPV